MLRRSATTAQQFWTLSKEELDAHGSNKVRSSTPLINERNDDIGIVDSGEFEQPPPPPPPKDKIITRRSTIAGSTSLTKSSKQRLERTIRETPSAVGLLPDTSYKGRGDWLQRVNIQYRELPRKHSAQSAEEGRDIPTESEGLEHPLLTEDDAETSDSFAESESTCDEEGEELSQFHSTRKTDPSVEEKKTDICQESALAALISQQSTNFDFQFDRIEDRMGGIPVDIWDSAYEDCKNSQGILHGDMPTSLITFNPFREVVIELRKNRNILIGVWCNMHELEQMSLIDGYVTLLTVSSSRPGVATLECYGKDAALLLARAMHDCLTRLGSSLLHFSECVPTILELLTALTSVSSTTPGAEASIYSMAKALRTYFQDVANEKATSSPQMDLRRVAECCTCFAKRFDAAVVLHVGAHIYPEDYIGSEIGSELTLTEGGMLDLRLRKQRMACLSAFFWDEKVWVCEEQRYGVEVAEIPLYLAAKVDHFSNLWGPWEIQISDDEYEAPTFTVAHGSFRPLVPLKIHSERQQLPEVSYHFFPKKNDQSATPEEAILAHDDVPQDAEQHPPSAIQGLPSSKVSQGAPPDKSEHVAIEDPEDYFGAQLKAPFTDALPDFSFDESIEEGLSPYDTIVREQKRLQRGQEILKRLQMLIGADVGLE